MGASLPPVPLYRRIIKWLLRLLSVLIIIILLMGTGLFFLPSFISTERAKQFIEHKASILLHRNVEFEKIRCTWGGVLEVKGLKIHDDPDFSNIPIISVSNLVLRADLLQLFDSCIEFDLDIDGLSASLIRNPDGRTNLEKLLSRLTDTGKQEHKPSQRYPGDLSLPFSFDIRGLVQLYNSTFQVNDRVLGRDLTVRDLALLLDIPSIQREAITLDLSMNEEIDGISIPPVILFFRVEDIIDPKNLITLDKASLTVEGDLSGLSIDLRGETGGPSVEGTVELDLSPLMAVVSPFINQTLPEVSGNIGVDVKITGNPLETFNLSSTISGAGLTASGGTLKGNRLGPLDFRLTQEGSINLRDGMLDIDTGEIHLQKNSRIFWKGVINDIKGSSPVADLNLGPVSLDLEEILLLMDAFLPSMVSFKREATYSLSMESENQEKSPFRLRFDQAKVNGPLLSGSAHVDLEDLELSLPFVKINIPEGSLSGEEIDLKLHRAKVMLDSAFPVSADLSTDLGITDLNINVGEEIYIERVNLSLPSLVATDITQSSEALFGIAARLFLDESGKIEGLHGLPSVEMPAFNHSLKAECLLENRPSALIDVRHLSVSSPYLNVKDILEQDLETGLYFETNLEGFNLRGLGPIRFDLEKVAAQFDVKEIIKGSLEAGGYDTESGNIYARGQIGLILDNLASFIPTALFPDQGVKGSVDATWDLLARIPQKDEIALFNRDEMPLLDKLKQSDFLKELKVTTSINDLDIRMTAGKDSFLIISGIQTQDPLELMLKNGFEKASIGGGVEFGIIEELPILGKLENPLNMSFTFSLEQEDLRTTQFSGTTRLDLFNIKQSVNLSLDNIDSLLAGESESILPVLFKNINGSLSGKLEADIDPDFEIPINGLILKGRVEAGAEIRLEGGQSLNVRTWAQSPGLNASLGQKISVVNLQSNIDLEKSYKLIYPMDESPHEETGLSHLSVEVINPESESLSFLDARANTARRILDDLRGMLNAKRSLSFETAEFSVGALPLKINNHEMEFRLAKGLPSVDYFQMDLLGGTLAGHFSISKRDDDFLFGLECSLSNLNASRLLPGQLNDISGEEAELSGRLSLSIPLSQDSRQLLQELSLNLEMTHIGSRTLERLLYAMDPYESNETIVQQRKLLGIGSPRRINLLIDGGNMSLSGQLEAKGISLELPPVERFNLTNLPIHRQLEKSLSGVGSLKDLLQIISGDSIYIYNDGIISMQDER